VRLMGLDLDLVLQYPSKPAPLPSLVERASGGVVEVGMIERRHSRALRRARKGRQRRSQRLRPNWLDALQKEAGGGRRLGGAQASSPATAS
jgi:hypothetical protein